MPNDGGRDVLERVERIGKAAPLVAISLYILGLLAVNVYLARFGIADFSLLKPRYVYTGALALLPVLLSLLCAAIWHAWTRVASPPHGIRTCIILVLFLLVPFAPYFLFFLVREGQPFGKAKSHAFTLVLTSGLVALLIVLAAMRARWWRGHPERLWEWLAGTVLLLFLLSAYLGEFADDVYPAVAQQLGGGKPPVVQFLFAPEAVNELNHLDGTLVAGSVSRPLPVLYEGTDFYLVPGAGGKAVEIDKDLVKATKVPYTPP